jgi:hypothetical protein
MWYDVAVVETASGYAALAGSMIFNLKDKQAHQVGHIWMIEHKEDVHWYMNRGSHRMPPAF